MEFKPGDRVVVAGNRNQQYLLKSIFISQGEPVAVITYDPRPTYLASPLQGLVLMKLADLRDPDAPITYTTLRVKATRDSTTGALQFIRQLDAKKGGRHFNFGGGNA